MFDSKKETAIKALEKQKSLLDESHQDDSWIAETSDMLRKYLGENSELYLKMKSFDFGIWQEVGTSKERIIMALDMRRQEAKRIVERSINFIKQHGVVSKNEEKTSFDLLEFIRKYSLTGTLVVAIFWFAYNHFRNENEISIQKQTNERLMNETERLMKMNTSLSLKLDSILRLGHDDTDNKAKTKGKDGVGK